MASRVAPPARIRARSGRGASSWRYESHRDRPVDGWSAPPSTEVLPPAVEQSLQSIQVDDNSDLADSLAMLLRLEGHEVEIAYSAPGTFEAVQRMRPEAVFLDIGLPKMDGYEIARRLCADPAAQRVHLIALTG